MSGIDKIYGTQKQFEEFKKWLTENEKPIRVKTGWNSENGDEYSFMLPSDYLYDDEWYNEDYRPISNFPTEIDAWLMNNCPLDFIQEGIKEQYNLM